MKHLRQNLIMLKCAMVMISISCAMQKKFRSLPTPLLAIEWWRVCLDEAQMFENVTTKASQIALQLQSVNKWCISGTPVQQSYRDFFGYFMFLGYDPYYVNHWFNMILLDPFQKGKRENFFSALRKILWRTVKEDVLSQIDIPPQEYVIHELEFSPVEKVYYDHIKTKHRKNAHEILSEYEALGEEGKLIDKMEATMILKQLTKLHMSCNFITGVSNRIVTKEELYDKMLQIRIGECSELYRKLIFSMNGAAGLLRLREQKGHRLYRNILELIEANKENMHTDLLQHIHALHNYCSLMESDTSPYGDLEECQYKLNELSTRYLRKFTEGMTIALKSLKEQTAKIDNFGILFALGEHTEHLSCWWIEILNSVDEESQHKFIGRLKMSLKNAGGKICMSHFTSISYKFREISGLKHCLLKACKDLHVARCSLLESMTNFHNISGEDVRSAVDCHLSEIKGWNQCLLCKSDVLFKQYESKLFCFTELPDSSDEDFFEDEDSRNHRLRKGTFETLRRGTHADSELEISLKFFISYSRCIPALSKYTEEGVKEIKLFEAFKKEFKALRNMWMKTSDFISALDELDMAKMSIRFRRPDEERRNPPVPYIIEPDEVNEVFEAHCNEIVVTNEEFKKTLGSVTYLKNLKEANCGNEKPTCPVCREEFVGSWYALQCGHCVCFDCCNQLITPARSFLSCPQCRSPTKIEDMYHTFYSDKKGDDIDLKGHFSTKVTAVMKCLLKIHREDPTAKILVFSKWSKVLSILHAGLYENDMPSINVTEKKFFYENIKGFKNSANMNVLLLPYEFGSKGLNLIEATYVILVEPCIIKAHMLQAVGRVHRIGQTKKTFVHLFFVKDTIDEKIYILQEKDTGESSKVSFHSKDIMYLYE